QDVHAHLHGGIPVNEVKALEDYFNCYAGLEEKLFVPLKPNYLKFSESIVNKEDIKKQFDESAEIRAAHAQYTQAIDDWWQEQTATFEKLPEGNINVFDLYHQFSKSLTEKLSFSSHQSNHNNQTNHSTDILDDFKTRGS